MYIFPLISPNSYWKILVSKTWLLLNLITSPVVLNQGQLQNEGGSYWMQLLCPRSFQGKGPWERWSWKMGPPPHMKHTEDGVLLTDGPPPNQDVVIHKPVALFSKMVQICSMGKTENGQMLLVLWYRSPGGSPWIQPSRRQNQASLIDGILSQDCTMCLILPWQAFYLANNFYPKSGHNSLICAPGTVRENLSVVFLKGRKSESEYTGSSYDNPWRQREMHGGHRAISKKLIILTRCLQKNLSASCWKWTHSQISKVSQMQALPLREHKTVSAEIPSAD